VNNRLLYSLNASNAKIEIDLGDQRARIYKTSGGQKQLVIETQISSGKAGHSTPTGSFRIQEKLQHKRSTLYGRWLNSSGSLVQSSGDSRKRPPGGATFVGTEMPYWMRVTGGIGMHIGYVPNGPASHGCIRVPSVIQPLIYSKVGVGTPVTIAY
jgi:lipoprotein-anchoring transpeptidase ErfK/SrfK